MERLRKIQLQTYFQSWVPEFCTKLLPDRILTHLPAAQSWNRLWVPAMNHPIESRSVAKSFGAAAAPVGRRWAC